MKTVLFAVTAVSAMLASAPSHALTFDFSFTNDPALGTIAGTVTGEIVGLSDNATSAATALYIDSIPNVLSLPGATPFNVLSPPIPGFTPNQIIQNTFTVSNGQITFASFQEKVFAPQGWLNNFLNINLGANSLPSSYYYNIFTYDRPDINGVDVNRSVYSSSISFTSPVSATPLPPTWTMMLIGLAGLAFVAHRTSRKILDYHCSCLTRACSVGASH
jgi:hypothetical protein